MSVSTASSGNVNASNNPPAVDDFENYVPQEIIEKIGLYSSFETLNNCLLVNRRWSLVAKYALIKKIQLFLFGAEKWKEYFNLEITDVPPVPVNAKFHPEKEVMFLMPKGLSLSQLGELIQNPKKGNKTKFRCLWDKITSEHGSKVVESSYWAVMSRDVIDGSRGENRDKQLSLAESEGGCAPTLLEAVTACFTEYVVTGNRLLSNEPWTYTTCQEMIQGYSYKLVVGGFSASGLDVDCNVFGDGSIFGVVVLRKF